MLRGFRVLLRNKHLDELVVERTPRIVIPAWSAGIQADMDVSEGILRTWMPAIHAGMTATRISMLCGRA
ncbi:MAG TPA: hypothetical protein VHK27_09760 [Gammaproteobacteria bacterium]|nr:hypothetical protein [Gammaproteobacteria bacterium]